MKQPVTWKKFFLVLAMMLCFGMVAPLSADTTQDTQTTQFDFLDIDTALCSISAEITDKEVLTIETQSDVTVGSVEPAKTDRQGIGKQIEHKPKPPSKNHNYYSYDHRESEDADPHL